jgi:hypothetical protein
MSVYTLASMFIVSCPSTNAPLPFTAFPSLAVDGKTCTCEEPNCGSPSDYLKTRDMEERGWPHGHGHGGGSMMTCSPPTSGQSVTLTAMKKIPSGSYVTFVNGLTVTSVQGSISGMPHIDSRGLDIARYTDNFPGKDVTVTIPSGLGGQTYVFISKSDQETTFSDTQVLFGPAVLEVKPAAPAINYSILKA